MRPTGEIAGVLQLLDRHERDCAKLADRHGAPLHRLPFGGISGSGLEAIKVVRQPDSGRRSRSTQPPIGR